MGFKDDGDLVLVLGEDKGELGVVIPAMQYGLARGKPPVIDLEREKALQELVRELIRAGYSICPRYFRRWLGHRFGRMCAVW